MSTKMLTVRLPEEMATALEISAAADARPVADEVRDAIRSYLDTRRSDPAFRARVRSMTERRRAAERRFLEDS